MTGETRIATEEVYRLAGPLLKNIGHPERCRDEVLPSLIKVCSWLLAGRKARRRGPDGTVMAIGRTPKAAMVMGNCILVSKETSQALGTEYDEPGEFRNLITEEYVHVLQYRQSGSSTAYLLRYLWLLLRHGYRANPFEIQAQRIRELYRRNPDLPPLWLTCGGRR